MSLFKRAAVRGMAHELVRQNVVTFPSKLAMDEAADAVADATPMPDMAGAEGHDPESVAQVAQKLMDIAHALMAQAGLEHHEGAPAGAPPLPKDGAGPAAAEAAKEAAYLMKAASYTPVDVLASDAAVAVMEKAAAEMKIANPSGALMHGGDKQNTSDEAAKSDSVAALDKKQRPAGYAHHGMGNTELETAKGEIGHQGAPTVSPSNSPSGTNSINADAHKAAALRAQLKQAASALIGVASPAATKNKETDAAKADSVAVLDLKNRPMGAYHVGQGHTNIDEDEAARIGKEQRHPMAPSNSPSGSNSAIQASKLSADEAFMVLFDKCAADVGPYLPPSFSDDQKVAAIKAMIGLDHDGRQSFLNDAYAKVAEEEKKKMPPELLMKLKGKDEEHAKKDDAMPAHKKESALLERVRQIAASSAG
jgi:hypothetical protein